MTCPFPAEISFTGKCPMTEKEKSYRLKNGITPFFKASHQEYKGYEITNE
jgi:hypothetical protein